MQRFYDCLGFALCVIAAAICALLHVATFVFLIPPVWALIPFPLMLGAILAAKAAGSRPVFAVPTMRRDWGLLTLAVFVYAVLTFVYVHRSTGGASSVSELDGQYVAKYKNQVIGFITAKEYRMFPNLWTRMLSAWIGMMAWLGLIDTWLR